MALKLTVPPIEHTTATGETNPQQVAAWVDALPLAQITQSSRVLCNTLTELNRSRLNADDRLKLLEIYRPALLILLSALAEDYSTATLPLSEKSRESVSLARETLIELGYGYKIVLLDKTAKLFGSKKHLPLLIHRAMSALSALLTLSYQAYVPTPAGVWQELHHLFRHALQEQVHEEPPGEGVECSVGVLYRQAILFALVDPYRLTSREMPKLMELIFHYAPALALAPASNVPASSALFSLNLDTDKPPKPRAPAEDERDISLDWLIDTSHIVHQIEERLARSAQNEAQGIAREAEETPINSLLQRLAKLLGNPPKRVFRRLASQANVELCSGVRAIIHYLTEAAGSTTNNAPFALSEWEIVNQSAGGLKVRSPVGECTATVSMGEVVGVRYKGIPGWSVGMVRWVQNLDDGGVGFGIQMLAPRATPVSIMPALSSTTAPQPGLLLAAVPAMEQPPSLVALPGTYADGRELIVLQEAGEQMTVHAIKLIEHSTRFELFHFSRI